MVLLLILFVPLSAFMVWWYRSWMRFKAEQDEVGVYVYWFEIMCLSCLCA